MNYRPHYEYMGGKLQTGIPTVDRRLSGGLHPGDVLSIVAPPATQSQTLMYQFMTQRPTVYVTTLRSEDAIEREIEKRGSRNVTYHVASIASEVSMDNELLRDLTGSRAYKTNSAVKEDPLDDLYDVLESIDETCNVIIDPTNPLERGEDRDAYVEVLRKLSVTMQDVDGVGILHCSSHDADPPFREETLMISDVVWEFDVVETAKSNVEYQMRIPKNRGGTVVLDVLTLEMGKRRVTVDDSRMI